MKRELRIVFMGTPEFAVPSLEVLLENGYDVVAVITAPDKPAGRGRKIQSSAVKDFADSKSLYVMQPKNLKDAEFHQQLRELDANLFIVVAFRMLPEAVWKMPEFGTFNLHASYLPQYRGAAPINRAIMSGETRTGVTTFFLQQEIDTGNIIFREETAIGQTETAGRLHDRLMEMGASLVLKTVRAIESDEVSTLEQSRIDQDGQLRTAPKIFREECRIDWSRPGPEIYNKIRGLSPFPAAFTELISPDGNKYPLKVFYAEIDNVAKSTSEPELKTDGETFLSVHTGKYVLSLREVQLAGKKKMKTVEFLRGFHIDETFDIR